VHKVLRALKVLLAHKVHLDHLDMALKVLKDQVDHLVFKVLAVHRDQQDHLVLIHQ
jgi:hypothetical protein